MKHILVSYCESKWTEIFQLYVTQFQDCKIEDSTFYIINIDIFVNVS